MRKTRRKPPRDYFDNLIELGDAYFYGAPPTAGRVTKITGSTIEITYYSKIWDDVTDEFVDGQRTMKCKSPEIGVCLDKTIDKKII